MTDFKSGNKVRFTRKSVTFNFDNMWKRQVISYYLPIFAITLNRDSLGVVTRVTKKYYYMNNGRKSRLTLAIMGFAFTLSWHFHKPESETRYEI